MMSRQAFWTAGGVADADFTELDERDNCAEINDQSIAWAMAHASKAAVDNYNKKGVKYVTGADKGPYNEGPLWIWTLMDYEVDTVAKTNTVRSPMMRTPTNYFIRSARGFHYCKVLSVFNVMEWMYVDSLSYFDGLNSQEEAEVFLQ